MRGEFVSGNYFSTLGLGAFAGRVFTESDDTPGAAPSTVLSYNMWQSEYASDPSIVGSTIYIQARPFTVIGIAPPGFFGDRVADSPPQYWMPIQTEPYIRGASSIPQSRRVALALYVGPGAPRNQHPRIADQAL